jgi:hypothetical protein
LSASSLPLAVVVVSLIRPAGRSTIATRSRVFFSLSSYVGRRVSFTGPPFLVIDSSEWHFMQVSVTGGMSLWSGAGMGRS